MKRNFIWGLLVVAGFPFLNGCKDDEPPKPAMLNFEKADDEVTESDGTMTSFHPLLVNDATGTAIEVKLLLDKPLLETSVVSFSLGGTATKNSPSDIGDYDIEGNNITLEKGATEAVMTIQLFEDGEPEFDDFNNNDLAFEDIVVTLESVISGPIQIGEQKTFTLNVLEDDAIVFLEWDPQDQAGTGTGDVDMDIFLWLDNELIDYGIAKSTETEYVIIYGGYPAGNYSLSYTYYEGTSDDLDIYSVMFGTLNGDDHPYPNDPLVFDGNYKLVNKNTYPQDGSIPDVQIVQTMVKSGINFSSISAITSPASGSRIGRTSANKLDPATMDKLKKLRNRDSTTLKNLFK